MFRLMPGSILLARKPAVGSLRAALVPAEEVFAVPIEVFPEVAPAAEGNLRGAAGVCTPPGAVGRGDSETCKARWFGRAGSAS